ncbi:hypothetical protein PHET_00042 [Paragonimus heterotremus]|uniref:C2 tensin-type domain-containing protein n=1 Tax=Paragonimus heterotremus TaxID=100268 RepID=A0A8J4TP74_9TREM|nr:hypothetical protein PHET_00042 [Paragonimus heterotremus]
MDEQTMPSAWIGPYPSRTISTGLTRPSFDSDSHPGREIVSVPVIGPDQAGLYGTPTPMHVPSSSQVPLTVQMPTQSTRQTSDRQPSDFEQSPLAYSLSAELASIGKHRFRLTYVTDRLLVVSYPPDSQEADHNEGARWLCQAFERRYGSNYRIFNLSGFTKELHLSSQVPVIDLFWPVPLAPGLEQLVTAIDQLDYWLHNHDNGNGAIPYGQESQIQSTSNNRVAVLHCTGPRSLLATYLAVYICQSKARFGPLCGQRPGSPTARGLRWNENRFRRFKNELILGHMILKRFYEDNLARELIPSQKRYVGYFSGLVTGALILQDRLVYLHAVVYRNPARGRFFVRGLETIAENNNGNSHYAQPEDIFPRGSNREQPTVVLPSGAVMTDLSQEQAEHLGLLEWYGLPSGLDMAAIGKNDQNHQIETSFPADQERLSQLTRSIEQEIGSGRRIADVGAHTFWQKGLDSTAVRSFMEGEGGLQLKIYQNLKLMHTTRVLCPNVNFMVEKYIFPIEPVLPLHGDILIACFIIPDVATSIQEIIFRLQFHTCAISSEKITFYKHDLDEACTGECKLCKSFSHTDFIAFSLIRISFITSILKSHR